MRKLAVALAVATLVLPPVPSLAAEGECGDNEGVTVVVDFQELGQGAPAYPRCASQPVDSGFKALQQAGIAYETTPQGFICRIAGKPEDVPGNCVRTPPASAFWAYWIAPRGGDWCYSNIGPGFRKPPPGAVEGWSFAKDKAPNAVPRPRYDVPDPVPGTQPNQLTPGDCDQPASPPTTRPGQPAPPATAPSAGSPQAGGAGAPAAGQPSGPAPAPDARDGADGGASGPEALPATGIGVGPEVAPGETLAVGDPFSSAGPADSSPAAVADDSTSESAAPEIDLLPASSPSSPTGAAVAFLLVATLASLSVWLRRRRQA